VYKGTGNLSSQRFQITRLNAKSDGLLIPEQ
jgi:hypothetical protein